MAQVERLKAGLIGCGAAARIGHIRWYAMHPDVELVGLADESMEAAEGCASQWGGKPYMDVQEMLEKEKPDVVSICSPVALHEEHAILAAEHRCHILCEKPMARTLEECDAMIKSAEENDVLLCIAFHKRFNVGCEELRRRLLAGDIGQPIFVRNHWLTFGAVGDGFRGRVVTGGGVFQDHGAHWIDQFRWWLGEAKAVGGQMLTWHPLPNEVEDHAVALLEFENRSQGSIEATRVGPTHGHGQIEETWIYGSEGALYINLPPWTYYEPPELQAWSRVNNTWTDLPLHADMLHFSHYHYKRQMSDFITHSGLRIGDGESSMATGKDGRKATEVILALYQSGDTGQRVTLPLVKSPDLAAIFERLHEM